MVNTRRVLWSANDQFGDDNNKYSDDIGVEEGYNHFELMNHEREYTLPGVFVKGSINPSLEDVRLLINRGYRF